MSIYQKLIKVQEELRAPKGQYNNFGKYSYRSCEDILEAVKPLCSQHGLVLRLSDEVVNIGARYYVKATAKLTETEINEEIVNTAYAREEETKKGMDGSQITGTASSYARKYALNGLFCIDDTKDADTDEFTKQSKSVESSEKASNSKGVTDKQLKRLWAIAGNKNLTVKQVTDTIIHDLKKSPQEMTRTEYDNIVARIEAK